MKPKFQSRLQKLHSVRSKSKADAVVGRQFTNAKSKQIQDAVNYCIENGCRGFKALNTGLFPMVKDRETINKRLDGKIKHGKY